MRSSNKLAVFGGTMPREGEEKLRRLGFDTVALPPYRRLCDKVASHADLLLLPVGKRIFTHGEYLSSVEGLAEAIGQRGYNISAIEETVGCKYPDDVLLNVLFCGKRAVLRQKSTSRQALEYCAEQGYSIINVNQGYVRCTACPLSDDAVITADPSIKNALSPLGIDVLSISYGGVRLDGYDYGFIGGACGVTEDCVFFAGDVTTHPDADRIVEFCRKHKKEVVSLFDGELLDVGSIFFI